MREILFRGKHVNNNEWVYGSYVEWYNKHYIHSDGYEFEIKKETVGQFTGLLDKNGEKIFEGDILEFTDLVKWGSFKKRIFREVKSILTIIEDFGESDLNSYWEIVGNIHDNKEENL